MHRIWDKEMLKKQRIRVFLQLIYSENAMAFMNNRESYVLALEPGGSCVSTSEVVNVIRFLK